MIAGTAVRYNKVKADTVIEANNHRGRKCHNVLNGHVRG